MAQAHSSPQAVRSSVDRMIDLHALGSSMVSMAAELLLMEPHVLSVSMKSVPGPSVHEPKLVEVL